MKDIPCFVAESREEAELLMMIDRRVKTAEAFKSLRDSFLRRMITCHTLLTFNRYQPGYIPIKDGEVILNLDPKIHEMLGSLLLMHRALFESLPENQQNRIVDNFRRLELMDSVDVN